MTASHDIGNQAPAGPRAGPSAGDGATPQWEMVPPRQWEMVPLRQ